jgi:hypothetical protein
VNEIDWGAQTTPGQLRVDEGDASPQVFPGVDACYQDREVGLNFGVEQDCAATGVECLDFGPLVLVASRQEGHRDGGPVNASGTTGGADQTDFEQTGSVGLDALAGPDLVIKQG